MAKRKRVKKYTLKEFQAWLEGIEEIQPDDWTPDKKQWDMIREKIGAIVEEEKPATVEKPDVPTPAGPIPRGPTGPMMAGKPQTPPPAPPPSAFESSLPAADIPVPEMTPAAKAALQGKLPTEIATDPNKPAKVPDIDTSKGDYKSSFG
jgi:hypothetical protein